MADRSAIEWTDATWNPIRARRRDTGKTGHHCEHVSEGCRFCYAEVMNRRLGTGLAYKPGLRAEVDIVLDEKTLLQPLRWRRPRLIFVGSMTDLFAEFVPDAMLDHVFAVMALAPRHTFQVLTKRPERMRAYLSDPGLQKRLSLAIHDVFYANDCRGSIDILDYGFRLKTWPLPNVWLGTSCEDQPTADARLPALLATPAAIHFVSAEPLLGPIDFARIVLIPSESLAPPVSIDALSGWFGGAWTDKTRVAWVIVGGESGPQARPMHPAWARSIRDQCAAAGVAFFMKQWGEWAPHRPVAGDDLGGDVRRGRVVVIHPTGEDDLAISRRTGGRNTIPGSCYMARIGKKAAGRLLDNVTHDGRPGA